ncbi:uncharacterized protein LOC130901928 [Diorhabda carinulata]|uniref:uncharacterized protein LOC130901928 n=1 Tax=Diorhabda carinulata TaxID=1163345 RepID=UPI0025A15654|nr:uncharacterized protein LOC130901928 [Diorhabda carinulata]
MSYVLSFVTSIGSRSKFPLNRLCSIVIKHIHGPWKTNEVDVDISKKFSRNVMASSNTNLFNGKLDRFKGITIDSQTEQCINSQEFSQKLQGSLLNWRESGHRGIWFKVHLNQSDWIPVLVKNGFKFHHAKEEYVMMVLWLSTTETSNIPNYAHTMLGVGAVVSNDNNQVLVVKEKYYPGNMPHYKLPGGYVEPGENIVDAAVREVYEETNIRGEFQSVLTLRHTHKGMFGCSDIYTIVHLKALTNEIKKCDREIVESKWMDISEYMVHPHIHELNKFFLQKYLDYNTKRIKIDCFHGYHPVINKPYTIYSVTSKDRDQNNETIVVSKD